MYTVQCTMYSVHKIHVKYTHTPHNKLLNTANRSSDVVFLTASCFLGLIKGPGMKTRRGCFIFFIAIYSLGVSVKIL